jgi:cytochrome c
MACHNADKGGANQLGPNLWDVLGEPIGQGKGFAFSDALSKKGGTWNWDNLSTWLTSPRNFAPGTKMTFAGLSNPQDRADVEAYLNQQSDSPQPLPKAPAAAAVAAQGNTGQQASANPPGTGPNNGPQKAGKEPTLPASAANKSPQTSGGEAGAGPGAKQP